MNFQRWESAIVNVSLVWMYWTQIGNLPVDCACRNAYIIYCLTTKLRLSRRQFILELMKELCKPKDEVGCVMSYPAVAQTSSTALPGINVESHQAQKTKNCWLVS